VLTCPALRVTRGGRRARSNTSWNSGFGIAAEEIKGLKMNTPNYMNEASWRGQMLVGQIGVRQSISELGFLVAGLFLAYLLSEFWSGLAIVVAAAMCGGAIYAVWRESRSFVRLNETLQADAEVQSPVEHTVR
jgi:hypothetical protein